jgi:hypothetical protein
MPLEPLFIVRVAIFGLHKAVRVEGIFDTGADPGAIEIGLVEGDLAGAVIGGQLGLGVGVAGLCVEQRLAPT